jgi:hypothetical protein
VAQPRKVTCLVTIHGVGFQQPADDVHQITGYADDLHRALKARLPEGYLSDDPFREISGAIYVRSDPSGGNDRAEGLKRLGTRRADGTTDPTGAALIREGQDAARLAHVALVYCNSEDWQHLHLGSAGDGFARALVASGRYLSIATSPRWLFRVIRGLRLGSSTRPSLRKRGDLKKPPSPGGSGLGTVLWGVINDTCAYICENDLRTRVRGFVWEALVRLAGRDDVEAVVINAHSQGTVIALDALSDLEPEVGQQVQALVTAGSPLRKYVDLFAWGDRLSRPVRLPWQEAWINFWDPADPAADPLRPPPSWKAGARPDLRGPQPTLFKALDPNWGNALPVWVRDVEVSNTKWSTGGGLQAHNYWDNTHDYIPKLADFLVSVVSAAPQPPSVSPRRVGVESMAVGQLSTIGAFEGGRTMSNGSTQNGRVRFPGSVQDPPGDDLSKPVAQLLNDLNVLGTPEELKQANGAGSVLGGPPQSVAIIEAGATALGKWWATALGAGAGLTGVVAAIQGIWGNEHDPVRVAFIAAAAVVLAALAISIGIIVSSDVRGRAIGAVAQYEVREQVASTFLSLSRPTAQCLAGQSTNAVAEVTAVQLDPSGELQVKVGPGGQLQVKVGSDWVGTRRVEVVGPKS